MNGKLSKKLRQVAREEFRGMNRTEKEIIDAHANLVALCKPRWMPEKAWRWLVKKVIYINS